MEETTRIFGIRAVIEAIESGKSIEKVFIQKGLAGSLFQELNRHLKGGSFTVSYVPIEKLNKLSKGNHQGVVANISPISFVSLNELVESVQNKSTIPLYLLLDGITDVRNFKPKILVLFKVIFFKSLLIVNKISLLRFLIFLIE